MKTLATKVSVMANQIENIEKTLVRIEDTVNKNATDFKEHAEKELAVWEVFEKDKANKLEVQNALNAKADASLEKKVDQIYDYIRWFVYLVLGTVILAILSLVVINFNNVKHIIQP